VKQNRYHLSLRGTSFKLSLRGAPIVSGRRGNLSVICRMNKQYYVYIMTNVDNRVLYTGVTSDLRKRAYNHRQKSIDGFTKRYNVIKLVYYEIFDDIENAILREKQIKAGSRQNKIELVNGTNSEWRDLYDEL